MKTNLLDRSFGFEIEFMQFPSLNSKKIEQRGHRSLNRVLSEI